MEEEHLGELELHFLREMEPEITVEPIPAYLRIRMGEPNYGPRYGMTEKIRHLVNLEPIEVLTLEEIDRMKKVKHLLGLEYPSKTTNLPLTPKKMLPGILLPVGIEPRMESLWEHDESTAMSTHLLSLRIKQMQETQLKTIHLDGEERKDHLSLLQVEPDTTTDMYSALWMNDEDDFPDLIELDD